MCLSRVEADARACVRWRVSLFWRAAAQEVHAGVNVVNAGKAGQGLCTVECRADKDTCRTTTVVFISPVKCDKVHVSTM